jgi:polyribonucleotide nucleotidyltransferase
MERETVGRIERLWSFGDILEPPAKGVKNLSLYARPYAKKANPYQSSLVVAGSEDSIVMVEGHASEAKEDVVVDAIMLAHEEIKVLFVMVP